MRSLIQRQARSQFGYVGVWECERTLGILEAGVTAASPETDCLAAIRFLLNLKRQPGVFFIGQVNEGKVV